MKGNQWFISVFFNPAMHVLDISLLQHTCFQMILSLSVSAEAW